MPLIIQDPRMPSEVRGTTNDDFTLNIDLAPTILSAAGIPVPDFMQGRDISDLYLKKEEERLPWRKEFFYEVRRVARLKWFCSVRLFLHFSGFFFVLTLSIG